jgi:hypothetical protein
MREGDRRMPGGRLGLLNVEQGPPNGGATSRGSAMTWRKSTSVRVGQDTAYAIA